jgi:hypothetical protein
MLIQIEKYNFSKLDRHLQFDPNHHRITRLVFPININQEIYKENHVVIILKQITLEFTLKKYISFLLNIHEIFFKIFILYVYKSFLQSN